MQWRLGFRTCSTCSLRQAIYINPDYVMGHLTLGNLSIMQGNSENAKRYFKNALDLLGRCVNDDILPEFVTIV